MQQELQQREERRKREELLLEDQAKADAEVRKREEAKVCSAITLV